MVAFGPAGQMYGYGIVFDSLHSIDKSNGSATNIGPLGFDGAWLEGEHGASDPAELGNLTRACDVWGMTSVARINNA